MSNGDIALTIFADASFHRQHGTAGWGAWMKGARTPSGEPMGGQIKERLLSANEAEMRALANALAIAVRRSYLERGEVVMVQSDCATVLSWILGLCPGATHSQHADGAVIPPARRGGVRILAGSKGLAVFISLVNSFELKIIVRHVRGHQKGASSRSAVNELCDRIAKRHQAERLKTYKEETKDAPALRRDYEGAGRQDPRGDQIHPEGSGRRADSDLRAEERLAGDVHLERRHVPARGKAHRQKQER
jgi:ribonuclease HI